MQALGIDIGTTSICGVVLDAQSGTVLRVENRKNDSFLPPTAPFAKEQDVAKITAQIDALLDVLYDEKTIGVIGVTGQMHGIVYLDQHGAPCSPLYTWQDGRGNETDENGVTYADRLHGATGFGLVTDLYNEEHGLIAPQAVTFCTIHDYIAMRLCQNHAPLIHTSDAASFGAYDAQTHRFLVHNDRLPNVVNDFRVIGTYHDTPVCVAIGDQSGKFFGNSGRVVRADQRGNRQPNLYPCSRLLQNRIVGDAPVVRGGLYFGRILFVRRQGIRHSGALFCGCSTNGNRYTPGKSLSGDG